MKILGTLISFLGIAFLIWQCKPTRYTADTLPETYILWGKGGGVVGKESSFKLLENGQIFTRPQVESTWTEAKTIKSNTAKALFNAVQELEMASSAGLDRPGNVYRFLEIGMKEGKPARMVWGDLEAKSEVPQGIMDLFTVLNQLVNE